MMPIHLHPDCHQSGTLSTLAYPVFASLMGDWPSRTGRLSKSSRKHVKQPWRSFACTESVPRHRPAVQYHSFAWRRA